MAKPLLSGASGDPQLMQRRLAPQAVKGVPAVEADYVDFRSDGGSFAIERTVVPRKVISGSGLRGKVLPGKFSIAQGPLVIGDLDPTNTGMLHFLANMFTAWARIDNTSWQKYLFSVLEVATPADPYLSMLNDNDVLPRMRLHDMRVGGFTIGVEVNGNASLSFILGGPEHDFHGSVVQTIGSGGPLVKFRRTWTGNLALDATDKDLFIDFTVVDAGVDFTWRGKIATAGVYSSTNAAQVFDEWFDYRDENGDLVGTKEEHIQVYVQSSPTLTVLDEYEVDKRRGSRWSQTLAVEQPIASVQTDVELDGVKTRIEGGYELTYIFPTFEVRQDASGQQGGSIRRTGSPVVQVSLTRDVLNLDLQEGILNGKTVSFVMDSRNNALIGASTRFHRFLAICPAMELSGSAYDTEEGGENIEEVIVLDGFAPSAPFNFVADGETYTTSADLAIGVETDQVITVAT